MCGINGILGGGAYFQSLAALKAMNYQMSHRGPDADGEFVGNGILMGHRRLSIIDLDIRGNQPMHSDCGRYVIVFNGEIYNYQKLRALVSDYPFKSSTDTEVLLALYKKFGSTMLAMLEGMFAMAIWDGDLQGLFLARDRFGKKPLYYWKSANTETGEEALIFSSEVRSILATDFFAPRLNRSKLAEFLQFQTVFDPNTLVEGIFQLAAGSFVNVDFGATGKICVESERFYNREEKVQKVKVEKSYEGVVKKTRELFDLAVQKRLVSDVDFGAFLSGGIDSSAVVAVMSKQLENPVKTFHIYFDDSEFSELRFAEQIAKKFKTDHSNILITPNDFLSEVSPALKAIDHPSADGINTYVVSKYTRGAGIKMALSGLGGDEIFGGYDVFKRLSQVQYLRNLGLLQLWELVPRAFRDLPVSKGKIRELLALDRIEVQTGYDLFRQLFSNAELSKYGMAVNLQADWALRFEKDHLITWVGNEEIERYMKPVLLRDTDQMSMAHGLEVRVPFLDHTLTDYVMSLPDKLKPIIPGKKLLIDAMGEDLPKEIWDRKKMGFVFPWKRWVNRELRDLVNEGLEVVEGIAELESLIKALRNTQGGEQNPSWYRIWLLSTLGHWMKNNRIT